MNVKEERCRYWPVFIIIIFVSLLYAEPLVGSANFSLPVDTSQSRADGPDLMVNSTNISVLPDPLKVGDTGFITAEVFNIGNEAASLVNVSFSVDAAPLGSPVIIPFLPGNSSENITKMWQPASPGNHSIRVVIDNGSLISELDEGNNAASIVVFVATASNIAPSVDIAYPRDREEVSGTVLISGTASDSPMDTNELTGVEVAIDSEAYAPAIGLNAWEYQWDTSSYGEGLHTINARSYDDEDNSEVRSIDVIVDNDQSNEAPVANISSPQRLSNFSVNETIFFKGNTSSDPDHGPNELNFTWEMGDGSVVRGANINYSYSEISPIITVTLRVYDGDQEDSTSIQIFINNTPPVAMAGNNRTAEIGETITFNGSGSYDPDEPFDQITNYQWNMGNGDILNGEKVQYAYNEGGGEYKVVLTVFDGDSSDNDSVVVSLNNTIPVALLKLPSSTVYANVDLYFDGSASHDPDGEIVEYYFDFGDGHSTGWTISEGSNHTYRESGEYAPRLKVKDSKGGISLWNSMAITVLPVPNNRPLLEIDAPLEGAVVASPLIVEGKSSDPDIPDKVEKIEVSMGGSTIHAKPSGGNGLAEWRAIFEDISAMNNGSTQIEARAFDGKGYSEMVILNVVVNNEEPKSIDVALTDLSSEVFPGDIIEVYGQAKYDTGVVVPRSVVTAAISGSERSVLSDANGFFSLNIPAPMESGLASLEISVENGSYKGNTSEFILVYSTEFYVDEDSVKLYRGEEEIIGYNDAVRVGETVELRIIVYFYSDAAEGKSFSATVNVTQVSEGTNTVLLENESISFTPDGKEQSKTLSIDWSPDEGSHGISVNVEGARDSSQNDDHRSQTFTVREKIVLADFKVTDIQLPEGNLRDGEFVTVSITVINEGNTSGLVNLSLYDGEENSARLIDKKTDILLKRNTPRTILINWQAESGHKELLAVVESSLEELSKENNRYSTSVRVYPQEDVVTEKSNPAITVAVIGIILVIAVAAWTFYRKKEGKDEQGDEADSEMDIEEPDSDEF